MRLLLISSSPVLRSGGREAAGSFVHDLAEALFKTGTRTAVVTPDDSEANLSWGVQTSSGFTHFEFYAERIPMSQLNAGYPGDWPTIVRTLLAGKDAVARATEDFRPDCILALWALPSGYWAQNAILGSATGKYGIWALGSDIWTLRRIPVVKQILRRVLKKADVVFADGVKLANDVKVISGRDCHFLPSARKLPHIRSRDLSPNPPYRIGYLGRWHQNKGVDLLLDGLELLEDKDWNLIQRVRICGGGPLESQVKLRVEKLRGAGRPCEVDDYLDKDAARWFYDWTDFVLLPSRLESVPVVFSDAMQTNRPIVAMPAGDLEKLVDKYRCGECAAQILSSEFANALRTALKNGPRYYASNFPIAAADFCIDRIASQIADRLQRHID